MVPLEELGGKTFHYREPNEDKRPGDKRLTVLIVSAPDKNSCTNPLEVLLISSSCTPWQNMNDSEPNVKKFIWTMLRNNGQLSSDYTDSPD